MPRNRTVPRFVPRNRAGGGARRLGTRFGNAGTNGQGRE